MINPSRQKSVQPTFGELLPGYTLSGVVFMNFFEVRSLSMQSLVQWFATPANTLALMVTLGVAFFLFCCLECADCSGRDKDDLFSRHAV
jgi:hypothetical protein